MQDPEKIVKKEEKSNMNKRHYLRKAGAGLLAILTGCLTLGSCDNSFLYDDEGDCSAFVRFKYDYNMKYADAFAHEVSSVTLYLLDSSGKIVWQKSEQGSALAREDYMMEVDVNPGTYSLLAWCGTKDLGSFTVNSGMRRTDLQCTLNRNHSTEGAAYVDTDLDRWFYGYLASQKFTYTKRTVYTVPLIKDTNVFRVVLQHVSGDDVDVSKFTFQIDDENGYMDWDNSLLADENITYYAWHTDQGSAEVYTSRATFAAALAELTTARLVKGNNPRLTVTNKENDKVVFSIPVIDYALLVKGFYNQEMDDQEFLDRQDEWDMTFFLDEGDHWVDTYIYINSWKIVLQSTAL